MSSQPQRQSLVNNAFAYHEHDAVPREIAKRVLSRLDYIQFKPQAILDLSIHPSDSESTIRKQYSKAFYVAMSPGLDILQQRPRRLLQRRRSVCGFGEHLPFQNNSFDFVFMNLTLVWITDWPRLLRECQRVLKPGGMLLFSSLGPDTLKELPVDFACPKFVDMHDIGDACIKAGMENPVMDQSPIHIEYKTFKEAYVELDALTLLNSSNKSINTNDQEFESCEITFEVIIGHAWAGKHSPQWQQDGEIGVPIDRLLS